MPRLASCCLLLLALVAICPAAAPPSALTPAEQLDHRLIQMAARDSHILANLTYLSDVIGPRLTGSEALLRANEWTAEKMRSYGLVNVELEPWTIPEGWKRGFARGRILEPDNGRTLSMASWGWYPGTKGKVEGDVVILQARNRKELMAYQGKLKNAIVLTAPPVKLLPIEDYDRPDAMPGVAFVREKTPGAVPFDRDRGFLEARSAFLAKEGVAAILLDASKPLGLLVTTGSWAGKDRPSASARIPTLSLAHNQYRLLYRLASRPAPARTRVEIEVENQFIPGPIKVFNTVGEIRGSDKPDEVVVIGAHLDSWDLGTGTMDNGTGTCIVLEAARILAKCGVRPRRTIRFCLFSGEEQGLHGSAAHVARRKDSIGKVSVALIHDVGTGRVYGLGCGGWPAAQELLQRELTSLRPLGLVDFTSRSLGGSDHMSFTRAGVPGFLMRQFAAGYPLVHHTQADTIDRAREEDLIQGAQVIAVTAMRVANLEGLLPRQATK
jgi:carboxypeptidase Q